MDIKQLKFLIALDETRHFGQAAARCHITQPTLSMRLRQLEDELGLELVRASTVGTHPEFVEMIREQVAAALAGGPARSCADGCCPWPVGSAGGRLAGRSGRQA